jgi:hypothetical protein
MGCEVYTHATDDGGTLVVDGYQPPATAEVVRRDGTLSGELAALEWVGEALAAGITFEALRFFGSQLLQSGWRRQPAEPSIDSISATVTAYLSSVGYLDIHLTEVRQVIDRGWSIVGTADGSPVHGRADPSGQLLHVRVD